MNIAQPYSSRITSALFALLLGTSLILPAHAAGPEDLLHHPAPRFVRTDLTQHRIDLSAYRGKVVLLNFWATWCAPCQIEMPRFAQWQKTYATSGLQVIAVSMDDDSAPVRKYIRRRALPFPVLMGDEKLGKLYGDILGLPITFLIDRNGNIAAEYKGEPRLAAMRDDLQRLLAAH